MNVCSGNLWFFVRVFVWMILSFIMLGKRHFIVYSAQSEILRGPMCVRAVEVVFLCVA